jgi:hypothetical protein
VMVGSISRRRKSLRLSHGAGGEKQLRSQHCSM